MIRRLDILPLEQFVPLAAFARSEGYRFPDRPLDEWQSGASRFDGPGEQLLGAFEDWHLIGIGWLHRDP